MNKLKLSTRLTLGFGVLALLIAFTAGMALTRLPTIEGAFHKVTDERIPRVAALNEVKGHLNQIGLSMRNMAIMSDAAEQKKEVEQILAARKTIGDDLDKRREELRTSLPIRRVIGPADVAALAVHLMTNTALTGATYDIDGGQQLVAPDST